MTTHRIFVAGGTGVLGRRAVQALVAAGHQVTAIARTEDKAEAIRSWGAAPARVDLFDAPAVAAAVEGHDVVANLATHIPRTSKAALPGAWRENDRIRREGSRILVDAALAAGATRYIQESVCFVYADGGDTWLDEDAPLDVVGYLDSLTTSLENTQRFTAGGGAGVFLRFGMFYAPDAHHVIDQVTWARRGVSMEAGDLSGYKAMIHADDAASAVVAALDVPAGIYNVADDEPLTRAEHVALTAELVGRTRLKRVVHRVRHLAGSKVDVLTRSQRVSNQRFRQASGWAPRYPSIREGYPVVFAQTAEEVVAS
jgi:nucleoside-diphosphate-sugar epimerase